MLSFREAPVEVIVAVESSNKAQASVIARPPYALDSARKRQASHRHGVHCEVSKLPSLESGVRDDEVCNAIREGISAISTSSARISIQLMVPRSTLMNPIGDGAAIEVLHGPSADTFASRPATRSPSQSCSVKSRIVGGDCTCFVPPECQLGTRLAPMKYSSFIQEALGAFAGQVQP
jgi:hypothetical protein